MHSQQKNPFCADCARPNPEWGCINLGILVRALILTLTLTPIPNLTPILTLTPIPNLTPVPNLTLTLTLTPIPNLTLDSGPNSDSDYGPHSDSECDHGPDSDSDGCCWCRCASTARGPIAN